MDPKAQEFVRLLEAADWSQAEAARGLHITAGAVSQICSGKTRPRPSTLRLLKLLLAKTRLGVAKPDQAATAPALEPWAADLLAMLRGLPAIQREWLLAVIKQMVRALPTAGQRRAKGR